MLKEDDDRDENSDENVHSNVPEVIKRGVSRTALVLGMLMPCRLCNSTRDRPTAHAPEDRTHTYAV